ncbi:hypothetical protein [Hyphomonas sp. BRH_c22]|uniref:hypothetical protein n=1 Tax=Hyphomonas sp. BRH_c22 TaxID=1629710 RepID=UPI000A98B4DC|nr:hypothetical protein [Hyphomonas sp. BRH_c22]
MSGREKEVALIRRANKAAAVGRLMLGELLDWADYISVVAEDLDSLPRRHLKSGKIDVRNRLGPEIENFCRNNFLRYDDRVLERLYDDVLNTLGLELPLAEFQERYAEFKPKVLRGHPLHATVCISLWGLQFKFPEDFFSKDIIESLNALSECDKLLKPYQSSNHRRATLERDQIAPIIRKREYVARAGILACFNLLESFLNGLAWEFQRADHRYQSLSNNKQKLVHDGSFRDKLLQYPEILTGISLWTEDDKLVRGYLERVKPFRDSLVHASPFSQPERYGGLDKLRHVYLIDGEKTRDAATLTVAIIGEIWTHVRGGAVDEPIWFQELRSKTLERGA